MIIHDQHVHSYYSFDSEQPIEEYLEAATKVGVDYFVLTDHFDINYLGTGKNLDFDIKKQYEELDFFQKKFPNIKMLKGIEIGYVPSKLEYLNKIIKENQFDVVNLSLHEGDFFDFYYKDGFIKNGVDKFLNRYFDLELEMAENFDNYDVFCHIDFGFKTAYLIDKSIKLQQYEDKIVRILKVIISKDKALEINVKVQSFINDEHTKYLLSLYKKLGGVNLTLSSDAHKVNRYRENFDHYINLIKEVGFDHLNYFVNRERFEYKI